MSLFDSVMYLFYVELIRFEVHSFHVFIRLIDRRRLELDFFSALKAQPWQLSLKSLRLDIFIENSSFDIQVIFLTMLHESVWMKSNVLIKIMSNYAYIRSTWKRGKQMILPFDFSCIRLFIHLSAKNILRLIGQK